MTPHWPIFASEPGSKRSSVFSFVHGNRASLHEDNTVARLATPRSSVDQHQLTSPTTSTPASPKSSSKRRRSLFSRSLASADTGELSTHPKRSFSMRNTHREPIMRWINKVEGITVNRFSTAGDDRPGSSDSDLGAPDFKRAKISSPFNFQHVVHTLPCQLPSLDFSTDHDLGLSMWASSLDGRQVSEVQGIKVESLETAQRNSRLSLNLERERRSVDTARVRSSSSVSSAGPSRRADIISRSASLASVIAGARNPPAMVHPAFRTNADLPVSIPSQKASVLPVASTLVAGESLRNLDVVPEEAEAFPPAEPTFENPLWRLEDSHDAMELTSGVSNLSKTSHLSQASSCLSEDRYTNESSVIDTTLTSPSSADAWDDEIDYAYELDSSVSPYDFPWRSGKQTFSSPTAHDSVLGHSTTAQETSSQQSTFVRHCRNKSSMTMTPNILSSPGSVFQWDPVVPPSADRLAVTPLPQILALSPLTDTFPALATDTVDNLCASLAMCDLDLESTHVPPAPLRSPPAPPILVRPSRSYSLFPTTVATPKLAPIALNAEAIDLSGALARRRPSAAATKAPRIAVSSARIASSGAPLRQVKSAEQLRPMEREEFRNDIRLVQSVQELYRNHALPKTSEKFPLL